MKTLITSDKQKRVSVMATFFALMFCVFDPVRYNSNIEQNKMLGDYLLPQTLF